MGKMINKINNRYGRLKVIEKVGKNKWGDSLWLCKCDCGKNKVVSGAQLQGGHTKSCGCLQKESRIKTGQLRKINEMGNHYGKLTVLKEAGKNKKGDILWFCKCDCGNEAIVSGSSLRKGNTKSCGCLRKNNGKRKTYPGILPKGEATFNVILNRIKKNAERRNLEWSLSDEIVKKLISQPCFYCKVPPKAHTFAKKLNGDFKSNGLDRINNNKGYIEGNIVPCCADCNRAKGTMSFSEFKEFINRVSKHFPNIEPV